MHPWILSWGDVHVGVYFAAIAFGLSVATFVLRREALIAGASPRDVFDVAVFIVPAGALGARLFLALEDPATFLANPARLWSPSAGFVVWGAILGAVLAILTVSRVKGVDPWAMADLFCVAFPMGQAFARMGCLGAGCCHGRPADWPLGVPVPWSVRYLVPGRVPEPLLVVPLHPAPLYESLAMLGLFVWLVGRHRQRAYAGTALVGLLAGYGSLRFVVEFFRGDLERGFWFGDLLSTGQVTSLVLMAVALALHAWRRRTCIPS